MICPTCSGTGRITHPALKGEWCCPTCKGLGAIRETGKPPKVMDDDRNRVRR